MTPSAVARPYADPPARVTAWHTVSLPCTPSAAASRVPGAAPRTAMAPMVPSGASTTVHPELPEGAVQVPMRTPSIPSAISRPPS